MLEGRKEVPGRERLTIRRGGASGGKGLEPQGLEGCRGFHGRSLSAGPCLPAAACRDPVDTLSIHFTAVITVSGRVLGTGDRCLRK